MSYGWHPGVWNGDAGITLNSEKRKFCQNQLKFLGHVIDKDGIHAEPEKVKSVTNMKAPTNISELRCFMGDQEEASKKIKEKTLKFYSACRYDLTSDPKISADASSYGLGAVWLQNHGFDWKPIAYTSCALTKTERCSDWKWSTSGYLGMSKVLGLHQLKNLTFDALLCSS